MNFSYIIFLSSVSVILLWMYGKIKEWLVKCAIRHTYICFRNLLYISSVWNTNWSKFNLSKSLKQRNTISKLKIDICDIWLSQLVIHVVYIQLHQYHSSYRPIFQVNFISYNNKWEIFWVPGTGLDEEFVPPTVQRFECVWHCDIKHKNTTVSSPVERHTQRLKSLLSRCIPNL